MKISKNKWGIYIEICSGKYAKYGGHWQRLAKLLRLYDIGFGFSKNFELGYYEIYYDGSNRGINLGWLHIDWTTFGDVVWKQYGFMNGEFKWGDGYSKD